jgi:hypothetical protein
MPFLKPPVIDPARTKLLPPPAGLAPTPPVCLALGARRGRGNAACVDKTAALEALDAALVTGDPNERDVRLVELEGCTGLPAGLARALRLELAPEDCGEVLAEPLLAAPPPGMGGIVFHSVLGHAIVSRLARTAQNPPTLAPPYTKPRVLDFTRGPLRAWFEMEAGAIEEVSRAASDLPYYAKGIAAIEAGVADLRLVEAARNAPIPDEFARDEELRNVYYASLDQWLDPRKDRGRDAALVGLKELALVGIIHDSRVDRARALLSRMYGGRRIDGLDALLLPPLPPAAPTSLEERLAAHLPTLYAGLLLDEAAATRPGTLRQLLDHGLPLPQRIALRTLTAAPEARELYARGQLELGREYYSAVSFDQAIAQARLAEAGFSQTHPGSGAAPTDELQMTLAVAIALHNGPENAADLMRRAPHPLAPGRIDALDAIRTATPRPKYAGIAAFDAALVEQLTAAEAAPPAFWREVAERYRSASALLTDPAQRAAADDRAKAADAIARAVEDAGAGAKSPTERGMQRP